MAFCLPLLMTSTSAPVSGVFERVLAHAQADTRRGGADAPPYPLDFLKNRDAQGADQGTP
ncbi:MAG: hypothetical protein HZB40_20740 [Rhodocyclales bacterium]|nr:hypothetical protein [Rhodocyclales bacterium]